ncbi:MAG: hypothetical protein COS72_01500 [Candidatus Moranbacteria bacterium CG06_land_8_20_14_3_00_43_56]|nr:MAG: hypothetical protein COS72_01500 [Candidatus Moranbacteria bacterium CG06_land_8_20_14_3_00_43_56]PIV83472.1 MAG: hypothetical protein COW51_04310 [Candidatus Moranbacteria bacterium CG17_big_fil_post_rev_8_21_14_2_50_44_12]PIW92884.1 MAG: hypothetical protein COZ87_04350 [Candidatus Moranbacteria bacterium CG_4_8_14_3_um_filter_43_15]PJA85659.1 MAG: hypothetical protein CO142_03055 [Candidatus Moranbacteria bacterium CG_4_9_14_3_um_filter_44_28]
MSRISNFKLKIFRQRRISLWPTNQFQTRERMWNLCGLNNIFQLWVRWKCRIFFLEKNSRMR